MRYISRDKNKGELAMLISDKLEIKTKITVIKKQYFTLINFTIHRGNKALMMFIFMTLKYLK